MGAGTSFADSGIPLRKRLNATYKQRTARKGVSSIRLGREPNVTGKTAGFVQQRLRDAAGTEMEAVGLIMNDVEVNKVYIGGMERNRHENRKRKVGSGTCGKRTEFGVRERDTGQVIMFPITDATGKTLRGEIRNYVAEGVAIYRDDAMGYRGPEDPGYRRETVTHSQSAAVAKFVNGAAHNNGVESVWVLPQRGFTGTFRRRTPKHAMLYLNQFAFPLNQGNVMIDTIDRKRSLVGKTMGKRPTCQEMFAKAATSEN